MTAQEDAPKIHAAGSIKDPLKKPRIREADGFNLHPMKIHDIGRLTSEIERKEQELQEDDTFSVEVKSESTDPRGSYESPVLQFGPPALRTLNLEPKLVAFNLGQTIKVKYTVNRDGETSVTSDELELNVLDFLPEELKAGVIFGKDNDGTGPVLDLTTDTDDRTVRISLWPLIAEGQLCWIKLKGKNADGTHYEKDLFKDEVDADWITLGYIDVAVPYSELKKLVNGSNLSLEYKVAFDQVDDESKANLSQVRSYTVKAAVVEPVITKVTDLDGNPVADKGETTATTLWLEGTAGEEVQVYVGAELKGTAKPEDGTWTFELTWLSVYTQGIKAVTSGLDSNIWTVIVKGNSGSQIYDVRDAAGLRITDNEITTQTPLMLKGWVGPGGVPEVYDSYDLLGKARIVGVDKNKWEFETKVLSPKVCAFKIKALPGSGPLSRTWIVNVKAPIDSPAITAMVDSIGNPIAREWATLDTSIKLEGTVTGGGQVDVYANGQLLGPAEMNGSQWVYTAGPLSIGYRRFTVKKRDGSQPESDRWGVSMGIPYIASASVPNGGLADEPRIWLYGKGQPGSVLDIYHVASRWGTASVDENGSWSWSHPLYADKQSSYDWCVSLQGSRLKSPYWVVFY
ncbi:hypothetical protein [Pseudomonas brassicacearum]|uniref:Ig-like domain repeat protein n=2 Tax=Pseudomonas TaxID=286 RepID=A0A423GUB4_9PSED|nr:hypothetical protein [Pseudomonas brassicacearum]RON01048.1 hypothetical protein BK658_07745 [Pseudomonas brassicacearum]